MERCKEERPGMFPHPASHSRDTHYGARVAPQRCPILRVSKDDSNISLYLFKVDTDVYSMYINDIKNGGELTCQTL